MNQPASGDQSGSDSAAMVEFHQENDGRRRAGPCCPEVVNFQAAAPFANHPGKNQPARLQGPERNSKLSAVILVLRRQHSEFEGEFLVPEPGFLSFSRSLLRDYCLHPVAIGSLSDAVALCFAESPPEFMLNIVEQNHVLSR